MKRFLTLLLAAAMVLSFAACGDNGTTIQNENEEDNEVESHFRGTAVYVD